MKAFIVGLLVLFTLALLAWMWLFLFPFFMLLAAALGLSLVFASALLFVWLLGKTALFVWRKLRKP